MNWKVVNIRVIAILVVVFGHVIILYDPYWASHYGFSTIYDSPILHYLKKCINMFQMELFFAISGFCFVYTYKKNNTFSKFLKDKVRRLLIPFMCIVFLWLLPLRYATQFPLYSNITLSDAIIQIFTLKDAGHLWFLPVLFTVMAMNFFLNRLTKNWIIIAAISVLLGLLSPSISTPLLRHSLYYITFFILGELLNVKANSSRKEWINLGVIILIVITPIGLIGYYNRVCTMFVKFMIILVFFLLMPNRENKVMKYLDKNSFGIYLFHSPILLLGLTYFRNYPPPFYVFLQSIIAIALSLIIVYGIRVIKFGWIIGERTK